MTHDREAMVNDAEARAESLAQSEVDVINYLLHEQSPESHQAEIEEERWFLELGERAAFKLADSRPGDLGRFIVNDLWPYFYRTDPRFRAVVDEVTSGSASS